LRTGGRRRSIAFFTILGIGLVGGATALYVGWVIVSWRQAGLLLLGILVFPLIITGLVLNTIFLVREIRRNEQHEAFINAVTHELKTPVASMKLYLQTLQNRPVDEQKRKQFYGAMVEDSDRLLGTIEQVLRAGQLGARTKGAPHRPIDLGPLVRECLELVRSRHHLAPTAVSYHETAAASTRQIMGDEEELRAVVSNLVDNAIKYSGQDVHVAVSLDQSDPTLARLSVRDRGIGISEIESKRIFRRFYRIPGAAPRVKGTGLGLFIVRSVIKRHRGKVYVESGGHGHGSTFVVELPTVQAIS